MFYYTNLSERITQLSNAQLDAVDIEEIITQYFAENPITAENDRFD